MRMLPLALIVAVAGSPGCAKKLTMLYLSDPPGATVYEGGKAWGSAPVGIYYRPGRFRECLTLNPVTFRWVSGAEVALTDLQACPAAGTRQQVTVFRPTGVPGMEADAHYAAALLQARAAAAPPPAPLTPIQMPRTCTSSRIGNQVFTTCS